MRKQKTNKQQKQLKKHKLTHKQSNENNGVDALYLR